MLNGFTTNLPGTCGVAVNYGFQNGAGSRENSIGMQRYWRERGTGFVIAGFINNSNCRKQYEKLADKYPIVYQSPVRRNRNSGNDFFFIIFDARS